MVHRDLKPGNVLLAADGPKVIDFGISRPSDSEMHTETGKLIGTPPFMAPEQFQRPREVGPAADVFALGSVLVHAATGRGPFDSESPYLVAYQVVHDEADLAGVPAELVPLIESCLAKDPADRPTPGTLMELLRTDAPHGAPLGAALPTGTLSGGSVPDAAATGAAATGAAGTDGTDGTDHAVPAVRIPEQRQPEQSQPAHPGAERPAPAPAPDPAPIPSSPAPPPVGSLAAAGPRPHRDTAPPPTAPPTPATPPVPVPVPNPIPIPGAGPSGPHSPWS